MREEQQGVAVVSGAGSGIGREIALRLARRGHPLALLGRRRGPLEETLAAAAATADNAGGEGIALVCDVRAEAEIAAAARVIEERWGAASIVVPAAGVAVIAPLEEIPAASFRETVDTNLTGAALLIASLLGGMKRRGSGWIFPILSPAARRGFPGWSAYCASKWGLAGLVAALREELSGSGVRITSIYPGATATPLWDGLPGTWDRARMVPATEVGRAVEAALDGDPIALVEEIHLGPAGGAL